MCSLYFLGVIAAFFGIGFFGVSTVETRPEGLHPAVTVVESTITASGDLEMMPLFGGEYAITFLRQAPSGERDVMEAQLFGTLVERNNCLYVEPDTGGAAYLIVWAAEYSTTFNEGTIVVLNELGDEAVRVGQEVYLSGGEIPVESQIAYEAENDLLPIENCPGPYWVMGDTAQVNE